VGACTLLQPEEIEDRLSRLGIVVALAAEARCLTNRRIKPDELIPLGHGVWLRLCGAGPERASAVANMLLGSGVKALLSWGTAGALAANLQPGLLILPRVVVSATGQRLPVDSQWRARLADCVAEYLQVDDGVLAESSMVLTNGTAKNRLTQDVAAVAVDMESAAVAAVAQRARIPFLAVRAVADSVERVIAPEILEVVNIYGQVRFRPLIRAVCTHPRVLADGFRLAADFRRACATLSRVAGLAGPDLQVG
jgi:adenosylhomocysteine nucleosidase